MKIRLGLITFLLLNLSLFAQEFEYRRYWSKEPLTEADFQGTPLLNSPFISDLHFNMGYEYATEEINGVDYSSYVSYTYADRSTSWIKEEAKDSINYLYNTTILNIVEYYSRKLERELNQIRGNSQYANNLANQHYKEQVDRYQQEIHRFQVETERGKHDSIVLAWYSRTMEDLEKSPRLDPSNKVDEAGAFSFDMGFGYAINTGEYGDYLNNRFDYLLYGFMYQHNRWYYDLRAKVGTHKSKLALDHPDYSFGADTGNTTAIVNLSAGFQFVKNDKWEVYPFVGAGFFNLSRRNPENNNAPIEGPIRFHPLIGLNLDFKVKALNGNYHNRSEWIIRTRFSYEPYNYVGPLQGGSFNISISTGLKYQRTRIVE